MILDPRDSNPERLYKRVTTLKGPDVAIRVSPDGIHWKHSARNPVLAPTGDTHSLLGWDDRHGRYLGYFRPAGLPRRIGISFSRDFEDWTPPVPILAPDDHDPVGTELYWMRVLKYEGVYLGFLSVLHLDRKGRGRASSSARHASSRRSEISLSAPARASSPSRK